MAQQDSADISVGGFFSSKPMTKHVKCNEFAGTCLGITTILVHDFVNGVCRWCKTPEKFSVDDVKTGECKGCGVKQQEKGKGGIWICGLDEWACDSCHWGWGGKPRIPSPRAFACETCQYGKVIWYQGGGYDCPRCNQLFEGGNK